MSLKQDKVRRYRYDKPISSINLEEIQSSLWDIQEECEEIRWHTDNEDGTDSLLNALDGDEDEAYEFKMAFADLCAECDSMISDLSGEWIPECFDLMFVSAGASDVLGYDTYERDYFGLSSYETRIAREEASKKLKRLTKDELIQSMQQCFNIYQAYMGLKVRYESLKAAIDILKDDNTSVLQTIKEIDTLYDDVVEDECNYTASRNFDRYINSLPQELWIS